jgi:SAM-dependent methyltransferase
VSIFVDYARYYDLFYKDKNYRCEVNYIHSLIKIYAKNAKKDILDIGCGTGNHAFLFKRKGYDVVGVDNSKEMIEIAKSKIDKVKGIEFYRRDAANFHLYRKFDVAVSLFHVISYLVTNESLYRTFKSVYANLNKGGIFIFDFWYGPAVLTHRPETSKKEWVDRDIIVHKIVKPTMNPNINTVSVKFEVLVKDRKTKHCNKIIETHKMRYFFMPELEFILSKIGFKIKKCLKWMSLKEELSFNSWYGLLVVEK